MRTSRNAFTLIEVLVVVAIIALLVAILIPSLARARDQARSAKCMANLRDMFTGANTFAVNHRGRFQLTAPEGNPNPASGRYLADPNRQIYAYESGTSNPELLTWTAVLLREAGVRSIKRNTDWGVLNQPASESNAIARIRRFDLMVCPGDEILFGSTFWPQPYFGYLSYGINEDVCGGYSDDPQNCCWKDGQTNAAPRLQGKLDKVIRPAEVLFMCDAGSGRRIPNQDSALNLILSKSANGPLLEYFDKTWGRFDNSYVQQRPFHRHLAGTKSGSLNIMYVDGHAGPVRRFDRKPTNMLDPAYMYLPKVRVSPYNPGTFPK